MTTQVADAVRVLPEPIMLGAEPLRGRGNKMVSLEVLHGWQTRVGLACHSPLVQNHANPDPWPADPPRDHVVSRASYDDTRRP